MKFSGAPTKEHSQITRLCRCFALQLDDIANVLKLSFRLPIAFATEAAKDVTSLLVPSHLDQPAWRLGHQPDHDEQKYKRYNLEGNGEAPDEGRFAVTIE